MELDDVTIGKNRPNAEKDGLQGMVANLLETYEKEEAYRQDLEKQSKELNEQVETLKIAVKDPVADAAQRQVIDNLSRRLHSSNQLIGKQAAAVDRMTTREKADLC